MVTKWGLSEKMGPLMYDEAQEEVFLGKSAGGASSHVSATTRSSIDDEVRSIIDDCYKTAEKILDDNRDKLDAMADALMKYETIDTPQIDDIMDGKTPRPPKGWGGDGGSGSGGSAVKSGAKEDAKENPSSESKTYGQGGDNVGGPVSDV